MTLGYFAIITDLYHRFLMLGKLLKNSLNQFLEENYGFYPYQFGFRFNLSTNNALMSIIENTQARLDDNELPGRVFVVLRKAFDTVDHKMFIGKPEHYGVRCVAEDWFCSYFGNKKVFIG